MSLPFPVALAVLTKNAQRTLPALLQRMAPHVQRIYIGDTGSRDQTIQIAIQWNAEVFVLDWQGFGPTKNALLGRVQEPWVWVLDADEIPPVQTIQQAYAQIIRDPSLCAVSFVRRHYVGRRRFRWGTLKPDRRIRLIRKDVCRWTDVPVHEDILCNGKVYVSSMHIDHWTASDLSDFIEKNLRYALIRQATRSSPKRFRTLRAIFHFWRDYLLRLGCLEGRAGFLLACTRAYCKFLENTSVHE